MTDRSEIRILTVPKWFLPAVLFVTTVAVSAGIFINSDKWSFGNLFGMDSVVAQEGFPDHNKFGVNSASRMYSISESTVRNSAALSGPGGSMLAIIDGVDEGWIGTTREFIKAADHYCITPVLRLSIASVEEPYDWGKLFEVIGGNGGKMVISIGNEVNHRNEYTGSGADYAKYLINTINAIRPHVGSAKIIASPLNTSAYYDYGSGKCADASDLICWTNFVDQMKTVGGWQGMLDGHASNPYPVGGLPADLYNREMEKFGYSKSVYIMETGPHEAVPDSGSYLSPQQFMDGYWKQYCGDSKVVMANFFNAAGDNPDPAWTGGAGNFVFDGSETWNTSCSFGDLSAMYNANGTNNAGDACEIVPRSEYTPMSNPSRGISKGSYARCVGSTLTPLVPKGHKYKQVSEIQLSNGAGGVYGTVSLNSVTVADMIQGLEVEREGETPAGIGNTAEFYNFRSMDVYYELTPGYPADGRFASETKMAVMSWPNEHCVAGNTNEIDRETLIPIPTGWACTGTSEYSWASGGTHYVEETPEEGAAYTRESIPMYFPLGTALGAIVGDPYNTITTYEQFEDFRVDKAVMYKKAFVGEQAATLDYGTSKIKEMLASIWSRIKDFFASFGIEAVIDSDDRLDPTEVTEVGTTQGSLGMDYAFNADAQPGEQNIPLPDIDYNQDCDALAETLNVKYPELRDTLGARKREAYNNGDSEKVEKLQEAIEKIPIHEDNLRVLLEECLGKKPRKMEIRGEIRDVRAPFIQILAHKRLQDVNHTVRPVCDPAEEGLYASQVDITVKWFDKNLGGGGGGEYDTCPAGNYLSNGSFETTGGKAGGTASGRLPAGWSAMWKKNSESYCSGGEPNALYFCKAPEFKPSGGESDQRRVLDGSLSSLYFSAFNTHDVILYQQASVPAGQGLIFSGYSQLWRSSEITEQGGCAVSESGQDGSFADICIVDSGVIDMPSGQPEVSAAEWEIFIGKLDANCASPPSETNAPRLLDDWVGHKKPFTSDSGSVDVFLRGYAKYANRNTDDYWDNVCLVNDGDLQTQSLGDMVERSRRGPEQSSKCEAVNWPEPDCEVSIEADAAAGPLLEEDMTFYMPGLGVMPSLTARESTGDGKSTNRAAADLNYCEGRAVSDMPYGDPLLAGLSALDVYIYDNLEPQWLAERWVRAIWPSITDDALLAMGNYPPIEQTPRFAKLWEEISRLNEESLEGSSFDLTEE